jgi:CDP-glucose 4,6-dehydratase
MIKNSKLTQAYKGKRVLVTGHTGFKGSWLTVWLNELGAEVLGYSLEPESSPNNFTACGLQHRMIHEIGDIRDLDRLIAVFRTYQPEYVFHLAAQSLVRRSYLDPKLTFDTNVGGTVNVLEAVRLTSSVRVFVNVTSDKCYENREWVWGYRESDPMGGHDPYSASKGCAELTFGAYARSFFNAKTSKDRKIGVASARAGNVIGGGDWAEDRLIPDCVRSLVKTETVGIRSPKAIRPWQHVLEPLGGYLWLGALLKDHPEVYSGAWNFGPGEADHLRVEKVVGRFIELWGCGKWEDLSVNQNALHEATTLRLCCDKAGTFLKWRSVLRIDDCLKMTADWYKRYYAGEGKRNMYPVCRDQIRRYTSIGKKKNLEWIF